MENEYAVLELIPNRYSRLHDFILHDGKDFYCDQFIWQ